MSSALRASARLASIHCLLVQLQAWTAVLVVYNHTPPSRVNSLRRVPLKEDGEPERDRQTPGDDAVIAKVAVELSTRYKRSIEEKTVKLDEYQNHHDEYSCHRSRTLGIRAHIFSFVRQLHGCPVSKFISLRGQQGEIL